MTPLDQARAEGYSDEEIREYISSQEPEWHQKYLRAKEAGYSDTEILEERQRRRLEEAKLDQQQDQQFQEEQQPIVSPTQEVPVEEEKMSPFKGTKAGLSAATLGLSEQIPGLKLTQKERENLSASDKTFEFLASFLPIEGAIKVIANPVSKKTAQWAMASPYGKRALQAAGRLTGMGLTGAALEGTEQVFKGELPNVEDVVEHGTLWMAIDAGLSVLGKTGKFVKSLFSKSKQLKKPPAKVLRDTVNDMMEMGTDFSSNEKAAVAAIDTLEGMTKPSERITSDALRNKKVEFKPSEKFLEEVPEIGEELAEGIDINKLIKSKEEDVSKKILDEVGVRARTEQELGKNIQEGIESEIQRHKDIYDPLYEVSEHIAKDIRGVPEGPIKKALEIENQILSLDTKPSGYQTVINTIRTALKDLGYSSARVPPGVNISKELLESKRSVTVSKMMELKRRLNQIIDYDLLDWGVKDRLKPLVAELRKSIEEGLAPYMEAKAIWRAAENEYASAAKKFKTENIRKIRSQNRPERLAKEINSPTILQNLQDALPENTYKLVEREIIEQALSASPDKSEKIIREIYPSLSIEGKRAAKEVASVKNPLSPRAKRNKLHRSIYDDLSNAVEKGEKPKDVLKMWKTERGHKIVNEALKDSPNKDQIVDYLNNQTLNDMIKTVLKPDGKFDYSKINKLVRDKKSKKALQRIAGKDAVEFFTQLERRVKELEKNLRTQENIFRTNEYIYKDGKIKKNISSYGGTKIARRRVKNAPFETIFDNVMKDLGVSSPLKLKYLLYAAGFGFAPKIVGAIGLTKLLVKVARKKPIMKAFKDATSKNIPPEKSARAIKTLVDLLNEEED